MRSEYDDPAYDARIESNDMADAEMGNHAAQWQEWLLEYNDSADLARYISVTMLLSCFQVGSTHPDAVGAKAERDRWQAQFRAGYQQHRWEQQ
jgi:hypothetical protein